MNGEYPVQDSMKPLPEVSVVIITKGRHVDACRAVASVLTCRYPADRREIVVLEETGAPEPIWGDGVRYETIPVRGLGFGYARNMGVRLARHEIILFTDDDCIVSPDWITELVKTLEQEQGVVGVGGVVKLPPCGAVGECENILGFPGGGMRYFHEADGRVLPKATFSTCNCAVRKSAVLAAGGFDESLRYGGEDQFLSEAMSRTGTILYTPFAVVQHAPRDNLAGVFKWFVRRGRAERASWGRKTGWVTGVTGALYRSQCLRLATVVSLCLLLSIPLFFGLGAVALTYYASTLWRLRWGRLYYRSLRTYFMLPVVKLTMDLGTEVGLLRGG